MRLGLTFLAWVLPAAVAGCHNQLENESQSAGLQKCLDRFKSGAQSEWLDRVYENKGRSSTLLIYEIDLPFDDAKKLENTFAQLPGDTQDLTFLPGGKTHARISGPPPLEYENSASSDVRMQSKTIPLDKTLCSAVNKVGGKLTAVSVQTANHAFDDGKLYQLSVP